MTALELTLSKIPEQRKPPRRRSLTLAAKQNILFLSEIVKSILLGSALNEQDGGADLYFFSGAAEFPPHTPLPPRPRFAFCRTKARLG